MLFDRPEIVFAQPSSFSILLGDIGIEVSVNLFIYLFYVRFEEFDETLLNYLLIFVIDSITIKFKLQL